MPLAIRNLAQDDFTKLWKMDWSPLVKERDSIYIIIAVDQQPICFVAYDDETSDWLGVLLATRSADGASCFINHLLVMPDVRGKGIGSALVNRLAEAAEALGIGRIWFFTSKAHRKFYEKLGFLEDYTPFTGSVEKYVRKEKDAFVMTRTL